MAIVKKCDIRIYLIFVHLARKQLCKNQHGETRSGNNIEVYEVRIATRRKLGASIARESFGIANRNCFYQCRYRGTRCTLPRTRNDDKVFRLRNQFVRDTALSRRETKRIRFANSTSYENTVYSRERDKCSFRDERSLGIASPYTVSYPTFTGRRAYVSADADGDGFARLDKDETSLCQPSASNKMASFVAALRISTRHDSSFLIVWSVSLLAFENFAKLVSRNSALQFVEITPSVRECCKDVKVDYTNCSDK